MHDLYGGVHPKSLIHFFLFFGFPFDDLARFVIFDADVQGRLAHPVDYEQFLRLIQCPVFDDFGPIVKCNTM